MKVHSQENLVCRHCEKVCLGFRELNEHVKTSHKETLKFRCDMCEYKTEFMVNKKRHQINLHKGNPTKCSEEGCDYSCKRTFKIIVRDYICDQENCQYKTTRKHDLQTHKENIHLQIKHTCEQCGFQASTRCNLSQHSKNVHGNIS